MLKRNPSAENLTLHNTFNPKTKEGLFGDEEKGGYDGEHNARPNIQDPMVFLKKLFTHPHQQYEQNGSIAFLSHLTPPDNPMRTYYIFLEETTLNMSKLTLRLLSKIS